MAQPTKKMALSHLTLILENLESHPSWKESTYGSSEKEAWFTNASLAIERIFGKSSSEDQSFKDVEDKSYPSKLIHAELQLKARISEIEIYWSEENIAPSATVPPPAKQQPQEKVGVAVAVDPEKARRVLVVHGRDERLRAGLFTFLRSIGLEPLEFSQARALTGKPMPYVGEILEAAFHHAQAVIVLLTPDDEARLRTGLVRDEDPAFEKELTGQARPNVLFEAGMALVTHHDRTILVQFGSMRPFSDVAGRHLIHMDNSTAKRQELADRLHDANCSVNKKGTDWHTAGDLTLRHKNETA